MCAFFPAIVYNRVVTLLICALILMYYKYGIYIHNMYVQEDSTNDCRCYP